MSFLKNPQNQQPSSTTILRTNIHYRPLVGELCTALFVSFRLSVDSRPSGATVQVSVRADVISATIER